MKRRIKRGLETFKNYVSKLKITQKILLVKIPLLKRSSSNLKLIIIAGCLVAFFWTLYWGAINEIIVWNKTFAQAFQASWYNYLGMMVSVLTAFFIYRQPTSLSVILQHMLQLKTKTITRLSHGLHATITRLSHGLHAIYVHTTKNRKRVIITLFVTVIFVLNLFFFSIISGQLSTRTQMYSYGSIQIQTAGIAAYRDASCTTTASNVPWGTIAPGSSGKYTLYIKNKGTTSLNLFLDTTNWNPTNAANYMTLTWNYNGQKIEPNQVIQITLTLSVSQSISGIDSFNFEIVLTGTS